MSKELLELITDLEVIFEPARRGETRTNRVGLNVSIKRMQCFAIKGTTCAHCGIVGTEIRVEKWTKANQIHVDLYAYTSQGNRRLMTIDHIVPRAKGGADHIDNYQPMCEKCNFKKGTKDESTAKAAAQSYKPHTFQSG